LPTAPPAGARIGWRPFSYDARVPSVRYRSMMPVSILARAGVKTSLVPPDGGGTYDCVVFQKAYTQADFELAQRYAARGTKIVFDLCDNHFYTGDDDPMLVERAARLRQIVDIADVVTVSTPAVAELLPERRVFLVDDALEVPRGAGLARALARVRRWVRRNDRPVRLVWFGNAASKGIAIGLMELGQIIPELEALDRSLPLQLTVISNSRPRYQEFVGNSSLRSRYVRWRATTFAQHFARGDICIIPMNVNPYSVCRTNNRVRTSLMLGVPVVATAIPSYAEFAPWTLVERWSGNIAKYAGDPDLARRHVHSAQRHITTTYTPERLLEQWSAVFAALLGEQATNA
jgi:hypothetical protein